MSRPALLPLAAGILFISLLTGCAGAETTQSPSSTPRASSSADAQTPTPTPAPAEHTVAVSVDGISIDGGALLSNRAPEDTLAALEQILGTRPEPEQPDPAYDIVFYDWGTVSASVLSGSTVSLSFTASDVPGLTVVLANGIGLGSTRDEAMAAGAEPIWDEDGDGTADDVSIEHRDVPGTVSLANPGEVGVEYIQLTIADDVVTGLSNGANDFSDL
ncbi:hypothetical protein SRABI76_00364 [Microbacterium oxydans]|uniref:hypothetical protein n=1 Tax=Microbacterium oxydans TaxID=82380 RepID=UPI001D6CB7E5|nr:hypothetical protein [Microbacterium oxydans]CAH0133665.1 hypothetical protein SRABI76_00364 [Microbacterium oxydans]